MPRLAPVVFLSLLLGPTARLEAQDAYFFHGRTYGSEALFGPVSLLLNEGFDIIQLENWDRRVFEYDYRLGLSTVARSVTHPVATIRQYGAGRFVRSELLPLSTRGSGGGQWVPNYALHLVGGGSVFATLREWYTAKGVRNETPLAAATALAYHLLNETVENGEFRGLNGDALADLVVFDVAGAVLFTLEPVRRLFGRDLHLRSWMLQPAFSIRDGALYNTGQNFALKWGPPAAGPWRGFLYLGMNNLVGLSYVVRDGYSLSAGAGLHSARTEVLDPDTHRQTVVLRPAVGLFFDRHDSLLASLVYNGAQDAALNLNVYPGLLPPGPLSPGFFVLIERGGGLVGGFSTRLLPGLVARSRGAR